MELHGKYTIFAEGARGHLGKQLIARYKLDAGRDPQGYAIGIKELWEIDPSRANPAGWCIPLAGRWTIRPSAAAFSTTSKATRSRSVSSPG
jgi:electron-transferring-flavoprotein dehydrogenase